MFINSFGNFLKQEIYEKFYKLFNLRKSKQARDLRKVLETFKAK